ncbi:SprT-like domain-containing protein [Bradyrhizobium sp. SZCCHNS2015]|uniref:SprT-like domain-containing protein n=1 Tax=Bradyrhizobium sp. SZCCHNS2015 TaxID=3057305 RepID=UPI0028E50E1C|nr:SprT-like domain-containing protein [Bradyrhizobium sp. SZCCHNS2015]
MGALVSYETQIPLDAGPTATTYGELNRAYDFFNDRLFGGELPRCLITMQRHKGAYGYFSPDRFGSRDGEVADEIALNPTHFAHRTPREIMSTLVHEMVHLWQKHFGKMPRGAYHDKQWAKKMHEVGLHPSSTGGPGGKETGQKVSHFIKDDGPFARAFVDFEQLGMNELFGDRFAESEKAAKSRAKKRASKTKFTCEQCDLNAWAKPDARLICGECSEPMVCEEPDEDEQDN